MNLRAAALSFLTALAAAPAAAQSVCLPLPRLLTIVPPGGQAGTTVDVTIGGEGLEEVERLVFSSPGIGAEARHDAEGKPIPGGYRVTIG
ncbi:MAG: serine protease, partial [Planctomycetes bacterium]|nr:serine protease [Planctomycetota bacterium]